MYNLFSDCTFKKGTALFSIRYSPSSGYVQLYTILCPKEFNAVVSLEFGPVLESEKL